MRTIFSRINRIKDLGAEDISKVEEAYRSVGVEVRKSATEFRDMQDILSDLNDRWDTLSGTQRSWIGEVSSGIRQKAIFVSMMDTFSDSVSLANGALEANGFAMEQNEKFIDSIQGRLNIFRGTMEGFWHNLIDSDGIKALIDTGTQLVEVLDFISRKTSGLGVAFATTLGIMSAFNKNIITTTYLRNLSTSMMAVSTSTNVAGASFIGLETSMIKATVATVGLKAANIALNAVLGMGIGLAISGIISGILKWKNSQENLRKEIIDSAKAVREMGQDIRNAESLIAEKEGLEDIAKATELSVEQKERLHEIEVKLAEIMPDTVSGYDDQNTAIAENTELIKENIEAKKEEMLEKAKNTIAKAGGEIEDEKKKLELLEEQRKKAIAYRDVLMKSNNSSWIQQNQIKGAIKDIDEYTKQIDELTDIVEGYEKAKKIIDDNETEMEMAKKQNEIAKTVKKLTQSQGQSTAEAIKYHRKLKELVPDETERARLLGQTNNEIEDNVKYSAGQKKALEEYNDALNDYLSKTDKVNKALDYYNENGTFSQKMIAGLAKDHEELNDVIGDEEGIRRVLMEVLDSETKKVQESYALKLQYSESFYNESIKNNTDLYNFMNEAYGIDLDRFTSIAKAKAQIDAQLISELSSKWSQYYDAQSSALNVEFWNKRYESGGSAADPEMQKVIDTVNRYNQAKYKMDKIAKGASGGIDFSDSQSSSKSSSSSSKQSEAYISNIDSRYQSLEKSLSDVNFELDRYEKLIKNTDSESDKIALLNKEVSAYERKKKALEDYNTAYRGRLKELQSELSEYDIQVEFEYDSIGNISDAVVDAEKVKAVVDEIGKSGSDSAKELAKSIEDMYSEVQDITPNLNKNSIEWFDMDSAKNEIVKEKIPEIYNSVKDLFASTEDEIQSTQDELDKLNLDKFLSEMDDITGSADKYKTELEEVQQSLEALGDGNIHEKMGYTIDAISTSSRVTRKLKKQFGDLADMTPKTADEAEELASRMGDVNRQMLESAKQTIEYKKSLDRMEFDELVRDIENASEALDRELDVISHNMEMIKDGYSSGSNFELDVAMDIPEIDYSKDKYADELLEVVDTYEDNNDKIQKILKDADKQRKKDAEKFYKEEKENLIKHYAQLVKDLENALVTRLDIENKGMVDSIDGTKDYFRELKDEYADNWDDILGQLSKDVQRAKNMIGQLDSKEVYTVSVPGYEDGTGGHPGGLAMVSDGKGVNKREIIILPNGEVMLSDNKDEQLLNLPKGSKVIPNELTEEIIRKTPKYAGGTDPSKNSYWEDPEDWRDYYVKFGNSKHRQMISTESYVKYFDDIVKALETLEEYGEDSKQTNKAIEDLPKNLQQLFESPRGKSRDANYVEGKMEELEGKVEDKYDVKFENLIRQQKESEGYRFDAYESSISGSQVEDHESKREEMVELIEAEKERLFILIEQNAEQGQIDELTDSISGKVEDLNDFDLEWLNTEAIDNYKEKIFDAEKAINNLEIEFDKAEGSPELQAEIKDQIQDMKDVIQSSQQSIYSAIKQGLQMDIENVKEDIEHFADIQDDLEYEINMTESDDYDGKIEISQKMVENQKEYVGELEKAKGVLESQRDEYDIGSMEWKIMNSEVESFEESLEDANVELKNMTQNVENISFEKIKDQLSDVRNEVDDINDDLEYEGDMLDDDDFDGIIANLAKKIEAKRGEIASIQESINMLELDNTLTVEQKNELLDEQEELLEDANVALKNLLDEQEDTGKQKLDFVKDVEDQIVEMIKKRVEMEKEQLDKSLSNYESYIDDKVKALRKDAEDDDYAKVLSEKQEEAMEIQKELNELMLDDSMEAENKRRALQEELADKQTEIEEMQSDRQLDLRIENLEESKKLEQERVQAAKDELDKQLENDNLYAEARKAILEGEIKYFTDETDEAVEFVNMTLDEAYDKFVNEYGEGLSTIGKTIKNDFTKNVVEAKEALEDLNPIYDSMTHTDMMYPGSPYVMNEPKLHSFDTGGYTGSGEGLAWLDEKEIVLNKMDTENLLKSLNLVRDIMPKVSLPQHIFKSSQSSQGMEFNFDNLINVEGNVDKNALPGLEKIAEYTIKKLNRQFKKQGLMTGRA